MAKELPYFRFTASEWLNDDISLESYIHKGIFIDVCAYFWSQDCDVTLVKLKKRFSNATNLINDLVKVNIIKHENKHDKINIDFLVTQYDLLSEKRKLRQSAGSKGGNAKAMLKQKPSYKDKDKDNNKDKDKKNFTPPTLDEVKSYFKENGYSENSGSTAFYYYDSAKWVDSKGNKIKNWKQKMIGVWFKEENKEGKTPMSNGVKMVY